MMVSGHTGVFALLGSPVEHSLSPALFNASFEKLGLDYVYICHDTTVDSIGEAIAAVRTLNYAGVNVTMPCKTAVMEYLDGLSEAAELIGAVNCIKPTNGKLIGYNTDGAGMMRSIEETGARVQGARFVIIGAGGAGSSIYTQAALDGAQRIDVFNRVDDFYSTTKKRLDKLSALTSVSLELHDLADDKLLEAKVREADVIIDATRVGMAPLDQLSNVKEQWLTSGQVVADAVYHPRQTLLLRLAAKAGATSVEGVGMLLWQAAINQEIWLDVPMPVEHVRSVVFPESD